MERKIFKYLEKNNYKAVANLMYSFSLKTNVKILNILSNNDLIEVSLKLKKEFLAKIIVNLSIEKRQLILESLNNKELSNLIEDMSVNETMQIIEGSSQELASKIIKIEEINYLLNRENFTILKPLISSMQSKSLSKLLEQLNTKKMVVLFSLIPKELAIKTFTALSYKTKQILLKSLTDAEIQELMAGLVADETLILIKEMPFNIVKKIMSHSSDETKNYINTILNYPKDSVGRIMSQQYVSVLPNSTVKQCLNIIKNTKINSNSFYCLYVVDESNKLIGLISIKKLVQSNNSDLVSDVMEKDIIASQTTENKKIVASKIFDYNLITLPIVNESNQLVGIVSIDDALYIHKKENEKSFSKMHALSPSSRPYLKTNIWQIWKSRIPWLLILLISATFTGLILNSYESKLNAISPVLFACVPMMMDTGGNCGSQSSVTVIRALSLNELTLKDWWKVLFKEIGASIILGLTLAAACFAKLLLIDNLLFGYAGYTVIRSAVVSFALFATVVIAKMTGCLLPIIAKKCKLDPAVMAAPFITTIVDSLSLILFCSMSVAILA